MSFSAQFAKKLQQFQKDFDNAQKKSVKKGLQEGMKEFKAIAKPLIPKLSSSTPYRNKGTVQRNLRHSVRVKKNKTGDYEGMGKARIRRPKGKRMAAVSANTKDKTDPFYWFMLDRGTVKMKGHHFMAKAKSAGEHRAIKKVKDVFLQTMAQEMAKYR